MDKDTFFITPPPKRVQEVNKLLQKHDIKEISKIIGIPSSTFSKVMREGDHMYHKADKQYYPFFRSEEERVISTHSGDSDGITFIKNNMETLKKVIRYFNESGNLLLDKRIYSRDAKYSNKRSE